MSTEPLALTHHSLLHDRLRAIDLPISEFSFANLYLFRETHKYVVLNDGEEIWIGGHSYDGHSYLMPTSDVRRTDPERLARFAESVDHLFPIPEEWLSAFPEDRFTRIFEEGDSDYLYDTEKIATFAGKKLHKKKNLLNFFKKHYSHEAEPLTENRVPDAEVVLNAWQEESGQGPWKTDYAPAKEALERMEELELCGGIWYVEGEPSGYILGEEITPDTYVLHFAKGLTAYKGVYQYILSSFSSVLPKTYTHLNLEQDLGKEALRHSKESYFPERKVRKYRVSLK
jgi:hypothetical protein